MTRQRLDLRDSDIAVLSDALETDGDALRAELDRRPWYSNDVFRSDEVVGAVLDDSIAGRLVVSPELFFTVLVHRAAHELGTSDWVDEWVGRGCRLPVFDVESLLEFTDAPGRLLFTARLLVGFAAPAPAPVPADPLDLDDLVDWLDAVEPADQVRLLRQLGDVALFRAGIFPDATGAVAMSASQVEHLGRSVELTDDELDHLFDRGSTTPGLDALETLSAAWYRAAVERSGSVPVMLRDVAHRIRAARRFLNYVADQFLYDVQPAWGLEP